MSNLSFMSKLVERVAVVRKQVTDYLGTNGLLPLLQSPYRCHHSTETALLKVLHDVLSQSINQSKFLGRLPEVDLIILEGEKCPSVRPSVRPQKVSSI